MAKKYTADTFEGAVTGNVTGSASLNVLKAGDTMTGGLVIDKLNNQLVIGNAYGEVLRVNDLSTKIGDIDAASDEGYLDISDTKTSYFVGTDERVRIDENSNVTLYGYDTNNASGAELHILKGQSNEVSGKLKLNSTTQYLDLEYEDPGATNIFRLYRDYGYISSPIRIGANSASNELNTYLKTNRTGSSSNAYYQSGGIYDTAEHYQYYTLVGSICSLVGYLVLNRNNSTAVIQQILLPYTAAQRTGAFARQGGHITNWSSSGCTFANSMTDPACWVEDGTNLLYIQPTTATGSTTGRTSGSFAAGCFSSGIATVTLEYSITYRIA